jgi:carotenoid cleavage dioxygenase
MPDETTGSSDVEHEPGAKPGVSRRSFVSGVASAVSAGAALPALSRPDSRSGPARTAPGAAIRFPQHAHGFNQPMRFEADVYDCEVIGKIPSDLSGAYVKVGPMWYFPQRYPDDGIVNGDGYISMFRFRNGRVDFKSRWVKTPRWENDRRAGRQLYGKYRNPFTDDPSIRPQTLARPSLRTTANTHTLAFAGKLFAVKEDALPYEMNPATLDTIGPWDFHREYDSQTFSAHNKIDPVTGELLAYGYEATGLCSPDLWVYTLDRTGRVTRRWRLEVPQTSMIHDMAATRKHFIFPFGPYVTSLDWLKAGNCHWGWDPRKPSVIGILPRDGDARDVRWFRGKTRAMIHVINAKTEGDIVTLYAAHVDGAFPPFFPYFKSVDGSPLRGTGALFRKYTFDLSSRRDTYEEEVLWDTPVQDIARMDTRFMTLPNRYAFSGYHDPTKPFDLAEGGNARRGVMNSYCRFDLLAGRAVDSYFAGPTHGLGESCFVPRTGRGTYASPHAGDASEADGYLIGEASNYAEMRSELVIADAKHLGDGDLARVILPFRSTGLHGLWIGDDEVSFG